MHSIYINIHYYKGCFMKKKFLKVTTLVTSLMMSLSLFQTGVLATSNASNSSQGGPTNNNTAILSIPKDLKGPQELIYNLGAEPKTLDPQLNAAMETSSLLSNLFLGLMKLDANDQPVPAAAKSVDISDDKRVYTFHLREEGKWTDGKQVKAEDFKYAWIRCLDPNTKPIPSEYAYQLYYIKNGEKFNKGQAKAEDVGIKVIDDLTLEVTLESPCDYFLSMLILPRFFPVRKDIVESDPEKWATKKETYVSNGPFKFEQWKNKENIVVVKNPEYFGKDNVALDKITFTLVEDSQTALAAFKAGEIDAMEGPPAQEIEALLSEGSAKVLPYIGTYYYIFNLREDLKEKNPALYEAFNKKEVRQAISLAIDKKAIVEKVSMGKQTPAWSFIPKGIKDIDGKDFVDKTNDLRKDSGDVEKAKELLAKAGYPNGEGFPTITLKFNNSTGHQNIAVVIQAMLKQNLNINVELANEEWAVFQTSRSNGDYEMARHGWIADYSDPMSMLDLLVSDKGSGFWGNNDSHFKNENYDNLIKEAKLTPDTNKRFELMHQAEAILLEEVPVIPIYYYTSIVCYKDYAKNIRKSALGFLYFENAYIQK